MIKKMTYKQLLTRTEFTTALENFNLSTNTELKTLVQSVDELFKAKVNFTNYNVLFKALGYISHNYLYQLSSSGNWDDMTIWLSSFKEKDARIFTKIYENLIQYLGFYKKIITDNGLAKTIAVHRTYTDNGTSSSETGDVTSETPQINVLNEAGNINFAEAMKYASNVNKNEGSATQARYGGSDVTTENKTWEEEMKNIRMIFFSELLDYINSIPRLIYDYFALETRPYPDLVKNYIDNLEAVYND